MVAWQFLHRLGLRRRTIRMTGVVTTTAGMTTEAMTVVEMRGVEMRGVAKAMAKGTAMTGMAGRRVVWEMGKTRRQAAMDSEARLLIQATMGWDRSAMTTVGVMVVAAATAVGTIDVGNWLLWGARND